MRALSVTAFAALLVACGGGPVTGFVYGESFRTARVDGLDCAYCGGRHQVFAKLHDASGATITINLDPDLDVDDVDLTPPASGHRLLASVVWEHEGPHRTTSGTLHVDARGIAHGRMKGCIDAFFEDGGHASGCFDVALEYSAGYE